MASSRPRSSTSERIVVAASGFTGAWALAWLGVGAFPLSAAVQGGMAVGGVMATSGLTTLWWKAQRLKAIADAEAAAEAETAAADAAPQA